MEIDRRFFHFKNFSTFNSKKLSANEENTQYTLGVNGAVTTGVPDIPYDAIVWIKDTRQQWTHGQLYDGNEVNLSDFLTLDGGELTGSLTAPNFIGPLEGNAKTATKAASADSVAWSNVQDKPYVNGKIRIMADSSAADITTVQFVEKLTSMGLFTQKAGVIRASFEYEYNDRITDTGIDTVPLYGAVVEVFGEAEQYTIRVTTTSTVMHNGIPKHQYMYFYNGDNYSPGWVKVVNSTDLENYLPKTGGVIDGDLTANILSAKQYLVPNDNAQYSAEQAANIFTAFRALLFNNTVSGSRLKTFRGGNFATLGTPPEGMDGVLGRYSPIVAFSSGDTHGFLAVSPYADSLKAQIGGGSGQGINWTAWLIHSKNIGDFALPKTGGVVEGDVEIKGNIKAENLASDTTTPIVNVATTSQALAPNRMYVWNKAQSQLALTLETPATAGILNKYMAQFPIYNNTVVTLPADISWAGGKAPTFTNGNVYQLSIIDKKAVYSEFMGVYTEPKWTLSSSKFFKDGESNGNTVYACAGASVATIEIEGYNTFTLYVRHSNGFNTEKAEDEGYYDYMVVSELDKAISDSSTADSAGVKITTMGNDTLDEGVVDPYNINYYTQVYFGNIGGGKHTIMVAYHKDGHYDIGEDAGYILIPEQ